jgi:MSHA biogenesis protein MshO
MQRAQLRKLRAHGVTLMEMVIVIILLGILGSSFGLFIIPMVNGYNAQVQRAALVDTGESALRRMARDIRSAVPNSVRVATAAGLNGGFALEMVPTVDGGRFCATGLIDCGSVSGGLSPADKQVLDITNTDAEFDIIGCFQDSDFKNAAASPTSAYRLVVGNKSSEVYADTGSPKVITPSTTTIALSFDPAAGSCASARHHVTLGASHKFCPDATADDCNSRTPRQRVFVVKASEAPVSYICNLTAGVKTLTRYWNYTFNGTQPTSAPGGSSSALLATGVSACSVNNVSGTSTDILTTGIVVISLTLEDRALEAVTLMHQAQIDNSQ